MNKRILAHNQATLALIEERRLSLERVMTHLECRKLETAFQHAESAFRLGFRVKPVLWEELVSSPIPENPGIASDEKKGFALYHVDGTEITRWSVRNTPWAHQAGVMLWEACGKNDPENDDTFRVLTYLLELSEEE
jgi:hypothetical protein